MWLSYHRTERATEKEDAWENASFKVPSRAECQDQLEKELQGKLDLSRIVRCQACGPDGAEVRVEVVSGTRDGNHAVPAEIGGIECRVIGDVKDLGSELQGFSFRDCEVLKDGEVYSVEGRTWNLGHPAKCGSAG